MVVSNLYIVYFRHIMRSTRDHVARVDIARLDNAAPDQTEVYNFMLHEILYELCLSVCTSLFRHLCVLLYTVLVFYDDFCQSKVTK